MKVNDSNLASPASLTASLASPATTKSQEVERSGQSAGSQNAAVPGDDVHLSELVRSLRALAADSPERQARLEQIARSYANGTYQPDTGATASKMINDALDH